MYYIKQKLHCFNLPHIGNIKKYEFIPSLLELLRSYWSVTVNPNKISDEHLHVILANQRLHIIQKLEAFLIHNLTDIIVGIVAIKRWVQARVRVEEALSVEVILHGSLTKQCLPPHVVFTEEFAADCSLYKDSETLVNPEILPILTSHRVTYPSMGYLVNGDVYVWLVSHEHPHWHKG